MKDIDIIFDGLMVGNSSVITSDSILSLNNEAMRIYNKKSLDIEEIDEFKKIIMICNVLYNRTDMTVLPIEDGFYDLLLEKYKTYDANFQVGSAVIDFKQSLSNDLDNPKKIAQQAIRFIEPVERDEVHQAIHDDIMRVGKDTITTQDLYQEAIRFTNNSYISKRSHNTEHNHPSLVGTLDKCKFVMNQDAINAGVFNDPNVKVLERDFFQDHINKGIYSRDRVIGVVCELKYDGISVEADCGLTVTSARTRGDTGIGQASDITPMLKDYTFKNAGCMIMEDEVGVKFEAIMTKSNLERFNQLRGRSYANCRSAIVGLFGASDAYLYRDLITLVPLAMDLDGFKYPIKNRLEEIEFLNKVFVSHGEPLRYCYFEGTVPEVLFMIKAFWDEAKIARDHLNFMYDGIVVSYFDEDIRQALGRRNYINKYSMAVKFDPLEKQTIFRGYTYEVGQHGQVTPMIHYDPVEFVGTIHTKSTGSSYNRFKELNLKYGDYINITYVNDVMPYVSRVECDHNRNNPNPVIEFPKFCPVCGSELAISDSGKSAICTNNSCPARSIQRMVNMFDKLNIKGFADAAFTALNVNHLWELAGLSEMKLIEILGEADGKAFFKAVRDLQTMPQKDYIVMGALGFTSMAYKKWQTILERITIKELYNLFTSNYPDLRQFRYDLKKILPDIGTVTLDTIVNEMQFFLDDIYFIMSWNGLVDSKGNNVISKGQVRFTGFRNLQLQEQLITAGYDAGDSSVTKKTDILLIPFDGFESSKVAKAKANLFTKIIPVDDFINNSIEYIGIDLRSN